MLKISKVGRVAVAAGVVVGAQFAFATAAFAHDTSKGLYSSDDGARYGYGGVTNSHTRVYSCDTLADGAGFRTEYRTKKGNSGYVDDANGSKSGCSDLDNVGSSSNPVTSFRVISKQSYGWLYSDWITA